MRTYLPIGCGRLLNIKVILDNTKVLYEGMIEDAPDNIKNLKYSKIDGGNPMIYYVYSEVCY